VIAWRYDVLAPGRVKVLVDGIPNAELMVFEHSGHFSPVEEPDAFRSAIFKFLGVVGPLGALPCVNPLE
jgi:pimeloyl-ACP methyl ester carboxylesterase